MLGIWREEKKLDIKWVKGVLGENHNLSLDVQGRT